MFAINGDSTDWQAKFIDGDFIPETVSKHCLGSKVEKNSLTKVEVKSWCGHGSVFTWNPKDKSWDEFDVS